jgi:hypothetical protein
MHPFRAAIEANDAEAAAAVLADGVVFRSPIVFNPYAGKSVTAAVVSAALRVFEDFVYETELASEDGHDHALMFRARVGDKQIQGCDFLHHDQDGLVDQLTVMVRPLSAALALRERMAAQLEALGASGSAVQTADGRGTVRVSDPYGRPRMRVPSTAHTSRPWRIHELTRDFRLEDVWALPTPGGPDDFPELVRLIASGDPSRGSSSAARTLWAIRWKLGELFGWDGPDAGLGSTVPTLRDRLPADLRKGPSGPVFAALPFTSLYLTDNEWAAEIANRTMHGVMHLGWVPDGTGGCRGQMAVYVKPNGLLGTVYMAAIRPFRHLIVYPPMLRQLGRDWRARIGEPTSTRA